MIRARIPILLFAAIATVVQAGFKTPPAATTDGKNTVITFAVDAPTDVAVAIVDANGKTVRHLAAGALGDSAPAPLKARTLQQSIPWDGTDDDGQPVQAGAYKAAVHLGLTVQPDLVIGEKQALGNINAIVTGPKGEVYVYDGGQIVVLDRDGKYLRQIMPFPADISIDKIPGLDPIRMEDGTLFCRRGYPSGKWVGSAIGSMAISPDGKTLYLPGSPRYARELTRIGTDGSVPGNAFDTKLTTHADNGYLFLACSPDGKTLYMAGAQAGYMGDDARELSYRQSVYRLLLDSPGPAETFTGDDENSGGNGFSVDTPKGLATDPAGRLYVCNHGGDNVAIYTPGAGFLKSVAVKQPQQIAVHPRDGRLYVLCGSESGRYQYGYHYPEMMHDAKIVQLSADGKVEKELVLDPPFSKTRKDQKTGEKIASAEFNLRLAVDFSDAAKPIVWVGTADPSCSYGKWGLLRIEDIGEKFGEPKDVIVRGKTSVQGSMSRMALDRERDILYLNAGSTKFARYSADGTLMEPLRLTNELGQTIKFNVAEHAVGPKGMIYFSAWTDNYHRSNTVHRATPEGKLVPFEGEQPVLNHILKGGGSGSSRGFAVSPKGEMFVLYYDDVRRPADKTPPEAWDKVLPLPTALAVFAPDGKVADMHRIHHLRSGAECIRVDSRGSLYVSDNFMPSGIGYPSDIAKVMSEDPLQRPYPARLSDASFDPLLRWIGCVLKFGPGGGKVVGLPEGQAYPATARPKTPDVYRPAPETQWFMFNYHNLKLTGAEWQFHGISPVPAQYQGVTHVERCVCTGARFDVDPFDRVFVPDTFRDRFTVLDSAGNLICRFGQYGNRDGTGLGLNHAANIVTDDDYAFIGDGGNRRLLKVKFAYKTSATCEARR